MHLRKIIAKLLVIFIVIQCVNSFYTNGSCISLKEIKLTENQICARYSKFYHSFRVTHSPILIESDSDFITYGFPGTGSENDPYKIEYSMEK